MKTIIPLAFAFLLITASPALAHDYYNNNSYKSTAPVIDQNGTRIGTVTISRKNSRVYTDYDFNSPNSYRLKSITTTVNGSSYTYSVNSPDGQTLSQDLNTYIAPRDAVLAFDDTYQSSYNRSTQLNSYLVFNCDGNTVTATANMVDYNQRNYDNYNNNNYYRNDNYYNNYQRVYPTSTPYPTFTPYPTATPTRCPTPTPKNYNPRQNWGAWDRNHYLWLKSLEERAHRILGQN